MKVGSTVVFLFRDSDGFGAAISEALHPNPNSNHSSSLRSLEEPFELSLESYGIKDVKASGSFIHFVDHHDLYQVSVLLMQNYEPPILACAINEVLARIHGEVSSSYPTILVPFVMASSKLKGDARPLMTSENKFSLYSLQVGPDTDIAKAMAARTHKASPSLQIYHEPLACLLHLTRVLNLPTFILIGLRGQRISDKPSREVEILYEIGELLASTLKLSFSRDRVTWNPKETSRNSKEPWRALYG